MAISNRRQRLKTQIRFMDLGPNHAEPEEACAPAQLAGAIWLTLSSVFGNSPRDLPRQTIAIVAACRAPCVRRIGEKAALDKDRGKSRISKHVVIRFLDSAVLSGSRLRGVALNQASQLLGPRRTVECLDAVRAATRRRIEVNTHKNGTLLRICHSHSLSERYESIVGTSHHRAKSRL